MNNSFVAVLMGSHSDLRTVEQTLTVLQSLNVPYEVKITSAHRTPEATHDYVTDADKRGCAVFIAAAGLAAHLAGAVAGLTTKPVIGIPIETGPLNGLDALLSTVQMPSGIPVACVAIGTTGAKNAGFLAAQIIGLTNEEVKANIKKQRADNAAIVIAKDAELNNDEGAHV